MTRYEILMDDTASAEEVAAVEQVAGTSGLHWDVRPDYGRKSAGDLPWIVMLGVPLGTMLTAFAKSYGETLGKHAADGTAKAAADLRRWLVSLYEARRGDGQVLLDDPETHTQVLLDRDLPQEAIEALWDVDPARDGGEAGHLSWDPAKRWHAPW